MRAKRKNQGFTLAEMAVTIFVFALFIGLLLPAIKLAIVQKKIRTDVNKIRSITTACASFAADWDGVYPSFDPDADKKSRFTTSTEAFNVLIPEYVDSEAIFWIQTRNPAKLKPPHEDGVLTRNENTYVYVTGQTNTSFSGSPLIADGEMESPGVYGKYHPWLKQKIAVVAYVGGHVLQERLTSSKPGATIKSRKSKAGSDIYSKREPGEGKGGEELEPDMSHILLP